MAKDEQFTIEILEQGWAGDGAETAATDLCSHGKLRITIGGTVVADSTEEFGISETALALLRTLARNHSPTDPIAGWFEGKPGAERLVFHGCGLILMMGCPIGMDWTVEHLPKDRVRLSNVRRWDNTSDTPTVSFHGLSVEIPESEYRKAVIRFATDAKRLFAGVKKTFYAEWDCQQYQKFWEEYDQALARFS